VGAGVWAGPTTPNPSLAKEGSHPPASHFQTRAPKLKYHWGRFCSSVAREQELANMRLRIL
jgi:hypothetical protein